MEARGEKPEDNQPFKGGVVAWGLIPIAEGFYQPMTVLISAVSWFATFWCLAAEGCQSAP
jgi:hypothetical protein